MANLLYLVHRLPFPPNKGDKVRSYHLLKHLAGRHRVFLGTFVDDPEDEAHVPTVRALCSDMHAARLHPLRAKVLSTRGLLNGDALTLGYYRNGGLARWVRQIAREHSIDAVVVFSSAMAQYAQLLPTALALVDFVDVDSAKWTQYAASHRWPLSALYRREGERLLAYERTIAAGAARSFFVTDKETRLFQGMAPECADKVETLSNGVDSDHFSPVSDRPSPFAQERAPCVVFTGAMDYWPNVDGAAWFVSDMLPRLREAWPGLKFYIVGRNPAPAVKALASESVVVTGTVADVRPYLQHAAVVVAPLRVARGIQNKILEAMAMARPVVAAASCVEAIDARPGEELVPAVDPEDYVRQVGALLQDPARAARVGAAGRQRVLNAYSWVSQLAGIDRHIDALPGKVRNA